jgi:metal-dependent amidase/aminoacylase/carboxypeptidase family protein
MLHSPSTFSKYFSLVAKLQPKAVTTPIATDAGTPTKPEAGVILNPHNKSHRQLSEPNVVVGGVDIHPTSPHMAPEQKPTAENFLSNLQSKSIHVMPPHDAAVVVTIQAMTARRLAPRADPPLNPVGMDEY